MSSPSTVPGSDRGRRPGPGPGPDVDPGRQADPGSVDRAPHLAASIAVVTFTSGGEVLTGTLHLPAGRGPHPLVVLLHGFPGHQQNTDLAEALSATGYAALVFHYRGSWGVGGDFTWGGVLEDVAAVVSQVQLPAFAGHHRLDTRRFALVGHSMGGFAALMTAADNPAVTVVGALAAYDFGRTSDALREDPGLRPGLVRVFGSDLAPLRGTSGEALVHEIATSGSGWRLAALADRLSGKAVLLVGAAHDGMAPVEEHLYPLLEAYRDEHGIRLDHAVLDADHGFSGAREELVRTVIRFLDREMQQVR